MRRIWLNLLAASVLACPAHVALAADDAEFAIRWDPADGGPNAMDQVAQVLGVRGSKTSSFVVQYFSVESPVGAAPQYTAIARERTSKNGPQSTYKVRGSAPFPNSGALADWRCPFSNASQDKREVDIGWTAGAVPKKNYSRSCDAEGRLADLLPGRFMARPLGCSSEVVRLSAKKLKIERWSLPGGKLAFEVSSSGKDTDAGAQKFAREIVRPLTARGVKPLEASKTELGSSC